MIRAAARSLTTLSSRHLFPALRAKTRAVNHKCQQAAIRNLRTASQEHVLILGNSNVGWGIAQEGVRRKYRVIVTTHKNPNTFTKPSNIEFIHTPEQHLKTSEFWQKLARQHISEGNRLLVVNTIGGSIPSGNTSIEDLITIRRTLPFQSIPHFVPKKGYPWRTLSEKHFNQNSELNRSISKSSPASNKNIVSKVTR